MLCKNCGKTYNEKMKFCVVCGEKLVTEEETVTEEAAKEPITETIPDEPVTETATEEPISEIIPEKPVTETATEEPIREIIPEEPVTETVTEEPISEIIPEEPVTETVTEEPEITDEAIITEETFDEFQSQSVVVPGEPGVSGEREVPGELEVLVNPHRRVKFYRNPGVAVLSVFLGLLCFVLFIGAGASYMVRYLTYPETVSEIVETIDVLNLPIGNTPVWNGRDRDTTVIDAVYVLADGSGLTEDDIAELYEKTSFRDDFTEVLTEYTDYIRTGNLPDTLTVDDIKDMYNDNVDYINKILTRTGGRALSDSDIALAMYQIEKADEVLRSVEVQNFPADIVGAFRALISFPVILAELALALILIIIIGAVNRNFYPPLRIGGITLLFSGGLLALLLFLVRYEVVSVVPIQPVNVILADISAVISPHLYIFAGTAAGLGVVLLIAARVLKWSKTRVG